MSEQPQDITQKHLYISDPDHPHYPEQGYLTGEVISLLGMPMAKFKLDNCRHGVDACFVSKGQLSAVISRPVQRIRRRAAREGR